MCVDGFHRRTLKIPIKRQDQNHCQEIKKSSSPIWSKSHFHDSNNFLEEYSLN